MKTCQTIFAAIMMLGCMGIKCPGVGRVRFASGTVAAAHPAGNLLRRAGRLVPRRQANPLSRANLRRCVRSRTGHRDHSPDERPLLPRGLHAGPVFVQRRHPLVRARGPSTPPIPGPAATRKTPNCGSSNAICPARRPPSARMLRRPGRLPQADAHCLDAAAGHSGGPISSMKRDAEALRQKEAARQKRPALQVRHRDPELPSAGRNRADLQRLRLPGHRCLRPGPSNRQGHQLLQRPRPV